MNHYKPLGCWGMIWRRMRVAGMESEANIEDTEFEEAVVDEEAFEKRMVMKGDGIAR